MKGITNMKLPRRTAASTLAALIVASGLGATSLAVGASVSHAPKPAARTGAATTVTTSYKFNGSYSGTISILWNDSGPSTASITGHGKGTIFGLTAISGSGSGTAAAQSDPINGVGVLSGTKMALKLKFATGATATAAGSSAPTTVAISGTALVLKGSGKFAGATGSLKVSGAFSIKSTSGKEKDSFSATLKGTIKVKTIKR